MVKIKSNVKPRSLTLLAAIANVSSCYNFDIVITSGNDSKHGIKSLHYKDAALDIRAKNFPDHETKILFIKAVLARLGKDIKSAKTRYAYQNSTGYWMCLENPDTPNEHFHIEYDPN